MTLKKKIIMLCVLVLTLTLCCFGLVACGEGGNDGGDAPKGGQQTETMPNGGEAGKGEGSSAGGSTSGEESGSAGGSTSGDEGGSTGDEEPEEPAEPVIWTVGNGGASITGLTEYGKTLTELVIPEQVNEVTITSIGEEAFKGCVFITSITVPNTVTEIGKGAFNGCSALTSLTVPFVGASKTATNGYDQVFGYVFGYSTRSYSDTTEPEGSTCQWTDIEHYEDAYYYDYYIPESLKTLTVFGGNICSPMFKNCDRLENVTIDGDVESIGSNAFGSCASLKSVTIGNGVTSIGSYAFGYCYDLQSVTIGNNVTSIEYSCFYYCRSLSKITFGEKVSSIGSYAFYDCSSLTSITVPNSVQSISDGAFSDCYKLIEVINNGNLEIIEGSTENGGLGKYALNVKKSGESDIVNREDYLFYTYDEVNYLLGYVGNATELTLPESYNGANYEIFNYAFYHSVVKKVAVPSGIKIGEKSFEYADKLTEVDISEGVTEIAHYAFHKCSSLKKVSVPDSLTDMGVCVFYYCDALEYNRSGNVYYLGNDDNPYVIAMKAVDTTATSCTLESTTKIIYEGAFLNCSSLTSMVIPDSVKAIFSEAFCNCTSLTSVTFGKSLSYIGMNAFKKCGSLKTATFSNKSGWKSIYYSNAPESVDFADNTENAKRLQYLGYSYKRG